MKRIIWSRFVRRFFRSLPAGGTEVVRSLRERGRTTSKRLPHALVRPRLEALEERTLLSTYVVNQTGDTGAGSGLSGDIRYCVNAANLDPGSTIQFDSSLAGKTITLNNGELPIKVKMAITGLTGSNGVPDLTISGAGKSGSNRVFDVTSSSATVTISNLTITGGNAQPANTSIVGNQGGDIYNGGTLTLINDVVSGGTAHATAGGAAGRGGAIFNAEGAAVGTGAQLYLEGTIVENSTAQGVSGGAGEGGGIYNDTNATVTLMPLVPNSGTLVPTVIRNNKALGSFAVRQAGAGLGGGIFNNSGATLNLDGSTNTGSIVIEDNLARAAGGTSWGPSYNGGNGKQGGAGGNGLSGTVGGNANGGGVFNTGVLTLQYTSFLGNQAQAGDGGNGGNGGNGGTGTSVTGGLGGQGGTGGTGGLAEGGGLYNGVGSLAVSNVLFGVDGSGVGNEAIGGKGGSGGGGGAGGKGKTLGGKGGASGAGGTGGLAEGGAFANNGGNVSFSSSIFTSNEAIAGDAGDAVTAGNGGPASGNGGVGGAGGAGRIGGRGGEAEGGGVFNANGNLSITNKSTFAGNQARSGTGGGGGGGGAGGTGGPGSSKAVGGIGGNGGSGGAGGSGGKALGGGFYNLVGTVTIDGSSFQADKSGTGNQAISGGGGKGGAGGNGGQGGDNGATSGIESGGAGGTGSAGGAGGSGGFAAGGAGGNQGGDTTVTDASSFTSSLVKTGTGGAGNSGGTGGNGGNGAVNGVGGAAGAGGEGGQGGYGLGGALAVFTSNLTITNSTFGGGGAGNQVIGGAGGAGGTGGTIGTKGHPGSYFVANPAGDGGQGGVGAEVNGGAVGTTGTTLTVKITGSTFSDNAITAGVGGAGGQGGLYSRDGNYGGLNGPGGTGGLAEGGAVSLDTVNSQNATLSNDLISANSASSGGGGAGTINKNSPGSNGGNGGEVEGGGLASVNYNLTLTADTIKSDTGTGGIGGAGGSSSGTYPYTFRGGNGGTGGIVLGGGVFVSNNLTHALSFNVAGGVTSSSSSNVTATLISQNNATGGTGGAGGNAGGSGSKNVTGGAGGAGGYAQGGGLYILAGIYSVVNSNLTELALSGNVANGGAGGNGGAGYNAAGGNGGNAQGGAIYSTSLNPVTPSNLTITDSTVSANQANGGVGGYAGSGTTPNGGAGGNGGNGGNAEGAGLFNANNMSAALVNSTFGGGSTSGTAPSQNYNVLSGGRGGSGGNAGTPNGVPSNNGGAGGGGGSVSGGNVYNLSTATLINDTLVYGQAVAVGSGGPGGSGAGRAGQSGAAGNPGAGAAGGYYAASDSTDTVGNTIIALNNAANTATDDVSGTFTSLGYNVLSSNAAIYGFGKKTDQNNATATSLNLGPLLNNGGPTATDALLNNSNGTSAAIDAGGNALVTSTANPWYNLFGPNPTDQRGPGFARIAGKFVDVGAYELNPPVITSLTPNSAAEQGASFTLTINGSGFVEGPNTNVYFGSNPLSNPTITSTQITVKVPSSLLTDEGTVSVTVTEPDGSGVSGEVMTSNAVTFTITEWTSVILTNVPNNQINNESDQIKLPAIASNDPDTTFQVNSLDPLPPGLSVTSGGVIYGTIAKYAVTNGQSSQTFDVEIDAIDDGTVQGKATFTWTVNDTSAPTLTSPGNLSNNEGDTLSATNNNTVTIAATDADSGTFTDVVNGQHTLPPGLSIDANTGVISGAIDQYAVTNGQPSQPFTVTISASDNGNVGSTTFTWTVNDTTPPTFTPPSGLVNGVLTNNEGDPINLQIEAQDADSFSAKNLPPGLSINSASGLITGTIDSYGAGSYSVTITATDNGYSSNLNFTWVVNDTTPPSFTSPGNQTSNESAVISGLATTPVDADQGSITDVVNGQHSLPKGLSIDPTSGVISGTIAPYADGTYNITITATDGTMDGQPNKGTLQFTWTVNDTTPPSFTNPGTVTSDEGAAISGLDLQPVDADSGSITVTGLPQGLRLDKNKVGVIDGTIGSYAAGTYTVKVSATDGNVTGSTTFTWIVNDTTPPALTNPSTQNNNEGDQVALQLRAIDAESFALTGGALPTGLSLNAATGLISGTIDPYGAGTYSVTVTAYDGTLSSNNETFTWIVADTTPPSFTNPGTQNNNEGDAVSLALDPVDAAAGSITATGLPTGLGIDPNTGVISGTIGSRAASSYTVTVSATDAAGNSGKTQFTWNVADTTPPALTNPGAQNGFNDTGVSLAIHAVDAESFSAAGLPAGLSINAKTGVISGTLFASAGTYQVTVTAADGSEASSVTFPWTVNQMPIAVAITNIQNVYIGLYQVETVTAQVTDPQGIPVNRGNVTFLVNGEATMAAVSNGFATATILTPMLSLDSTILNDDFSPHALDAVFSDPAGIFGSGSVSATETAMLLDFLNWLETLQFSSLAGQLVQLQ